MKDLLIATDFSENASHAARYGYQLAKQLKVNIVLCNAFVVPAEILQAGTIVWPEYEYDELVKDYRHSLNELKGKLAGDDNDGKFHPAVHCKSEVGTVQTVINQLASAKNIGITVMGTHGSSGLSTLMLGNHSRTMIEQTTTPLLLVPFSAPIQPIKKVAFATDFSDLEHDLDAVYNLIPMMKTLHAELLITHVNDSKQQTHRLKKFIDNFLVDISNKADYPNIYYRIVKNRTPELGLDWLCEHGQVDMLAMVHRKHSLLSKIVTGSHTQKMAGRISVPLLVLPEKNG